MRLSLVVAFLALLVTMVSAWTKEDHEIFDLVTALEAAEGKGTTFYSWLDVAPSASLAEINKAYRKKSILLHPDKNPGVKGIQERFARLGVIANIMRSPEGRKRYDFFYKNGVPKWRGTGYYYSRFRPGVLMVLAFLVILTSGLQYLVQKMNYIRDLEKVRQTIRDARVAAWGPKLLPLEGRRKVKVNLGGGPRMDPEGNLLAGKVIDMIVDGDSVYICDGPELHLLDESSATPPAFRRTWFVNSIGRVFCRKTSTTVDAKEEESEEENKPGTVTPNEEDPQKVARTPATMAGGRRRKAVRNR